MADKGIIKMNINALSKYVILFLFAVLVVLTILLMFYSAQNKRLERENVRLKEMVELRDAAITEIDKNIAALQQQVLEAESICNERLKARNDVLLLLKNKDSPKQLQPAASKNIGQAKNNNGVTAAPLLTGGIVDDEESIFIVDSINSYWMQFAQPDNGKK